MTTAPNALADLIERWNSPEGHPLCECGCGEAVKLLAKSDARRGHVKGAPARFISGHNKRGTTNLTRFLQEGECWVWTGPINRKGYGYCQVGGVRKNAHRALFERERGALPRSLHLDHLCRNKRCVRPSHMEPVTPAENNRRKAIPARPANYGATS